MAVCAASMSSLACQSQASSCFAGAGPRGVTSQWNSFVASPGCSTPWRYQKCGGQNSRHSQSNTLHPGKTHLVPGGRWVRSVRTQTRSIIPADAALSASHQDSAPPLTAGTHRLLVCTGDVMGNIHAANLVKAMKEEHRVRQGVTTQGTHGHSGKGEREEVQHSLEFFAVAGEEVASAGATLVASTGGLSSIGIFEAIPLVLPSLTVLGTVEAFLRDKRPDAVVLVDYPGINMRIAKLARSILGGAVRIHYFIPPNEWLFWPWRAKAVTSLCDSVICTYTDEAQAYRRAASSADPGETAGTGGTAEVIQFGHPLADCCRSMPPSAESRRMLGVPQGAAVVALVPASRAQEMRLVWPTLLRSAEIMHQALNKAAGAGSREVAFVVPVADPAFLGELQETLKDSPIAGYCILCVAKQNKPSTRTSGGTPGAPSPGLETPEAHEASTKCRVCMVPSSLHALACADVALTKSGSVTLELALLNIPQVVVYRVSAATAFLARQVFRFRPAHVSLVNLMLGRGAVPEFLQEAAQPQHIAREALALLEQGDETESRSGEQVEGGQQEAPALPSAALAAQRGAYAELQRMVGGDREAYVPAARHILQSLEGG